MFWRPPCSAVSRRVCIQVGQHTFSDIDYADDVALLVNKEESFRTALAAMDEEASSVSASLGLDKDPESRSHGSVRVVRTTSKVNGKC